MSKHNLTPKQLIKILHMNGFVFVRQNGSHAIFKNFDKNLKVVIPIHSKEIPIGTLKAILKDAEINL